MKKLWIGVVIVLVVVITTMLVLLKTREEAKEIKIGAILPLTSDIAAYGENARNGILLAVEEINGRAALVVRKSVSFLRIVRGFLTQVYLPCKSL